MAAPSRTPLPPGVPNSMLAAITAFREHSGDYRNLCRRICDLSMEMFGTRQLSPSQRAQLMASLAAEKSKFESLISEDVAHRTTDQFMPPPPRAKELYGRICDKKEVVDVGSGNMLRITPESGRLKLTAIDPELPDDLKATLVKIKREATPLDVAGKTITSFNVLPNIKPDSELRKAIENTDGLHVIPDHTALEQKGVGRWEDGRFHVNAPNQVFDDYPVSGPGIPLDGYKLVSYVSPVNVSVTTKNSCEGSYTPKIDGSPGDPSAMNWHDVGWKWDGVPYELELQSSGETTLTMRNGKYFECLSDTGYRDLQMSVHLERVEHDVNVRWVLLRVECYNGFIPPHSGEFLRYFADRVSITIDGDKVYGPPELDLKLGPILGGVRCPVDGVISRFDERDYYYKPGWTLDLTPEGIDYVKDFARGAGLQFACDDVKPGLCEYKVLRANGRIGLTFVRPRRDKILPTTNGTIAYILGLPTLVELVAVSGSTPATIGLRDYFLEL